jgi:hypothetical protein
MVRGGPMQSDVVRHDSRVRRRLREFPVERELACMLAGIISPGTWSCTDDKGSLKKEVG